MTRFARAMPSLSLAVLAAVTIGACGESVAEYIAARRELATAQLARIDAVRSLARAEPHHDWATMKDPGPLVICDLVIPPHRDAGCDTWVIDQAQLEQPTAYLDPPPLLSYGQADWLVLTTSLVTAGRFPPNANYPSGAEADRLTRPILYAFSWLEQVRYVIVVRQDELTAPALAADQKSYEPGSFRGEATLFALLPEPHSLGGAPFAHTMTGELQVRMRRGGIQLNQVNKAFADGVRQSLAEALVSRLNHLERPPPATQPQAP